MKECNCGRIPPCYGCLELAIYEEAKKVYDEWKKSRARYDKLIDKLRAKLMEGGFLDDTHDKVYELNRQMCDIDKHLSEAGYFRMICDGQIETRKKLIDMEEKKTKKMTKAEAFEWLKHKKVAVVGDAYALQTKLFEIGYKWCDGSIVAMPMIDFLLIDDETFQFTESLSHFRNCGYGEISADDILSIEIVGEEDTSLPTVEFERYVKILQAWSKRINSSFVFSERGMGIVRGDLLTKLEGEEKGAYYKMEATL